jgi:hypothetical protein
MRLHTVETDTKEYEQSQIRQLNILRGLTPQSLKFDDILNNPQYSSTLGKTQELLDLVEEYRNLRNQIHLPGDIVEAPHINKYMGDSVVKLLVTFINENIVECNNKLIDKWELNPAGKVPPLTYF